MVRTVRLRRPSLPSNFDRIKPRKREREREREKDSQASESSASFRQYQLLFYRLVRNFFSSRLERRLRCGWMFLLLFQLPLCFFFFFFFFFVSPYFVDYAYARPRWLYLPLIEFDTGNWLLARGLFQLFSRGRSLDWPTERVDLLDEWMWSLSLRVSFFSLSLSLSLSLFLFLELVEFSRFRNLSSLRCPANLTLITSLQLCTQNIFHFSLQTLGQFQTVEKFVCIMMWASPSINTQRNKRLWMSWSMIADDDLLSENKRNRWITYV